MAELNANDNSAFAKSRQRYADLKIDAGLRLQKIARHVRVHKTVALVLKGLSVFGSGIIAVGASSVVARIISVSIFFGTLFDGFLSNHRWLMSLTTAKYAYTQMIGAVEHDFKKNDIQLSRIEKSDPTRYEELMIGLHERLSDWLFKGTALIEEKLQSRDVESLQELALENRKKKDDDQTTA